LHRTLRGGGHARRRGWHLPRRLGFEVPRHAPLDLDGWLLRGLVLANFTAALNSLMLAGNVDLPLHHLVLTGDLDDPVIPLK
jgi:hypothetical protein